MTSVDRTVLVLGGAGGVGTGIVEALLARGTFARVLAASRRAARLESLRARTDGDPRLVCVRGGVDDRAAAEALLAAALRHGPLGAVVASLGGWWTGPPLAGLDDDAWDRGLAALLRPHFVAARTFVPALRVAGARYLLVGGDAALAPVAGSSLVSIAGAAQAMLARSLAAEARDAPPVVAELMICGAVRTHAAHHGPRTPGEITAREAGDAVAAMLHDGTAGDWPRAARDGPIVRMFPRLT